MSKNLFEDRPFEGATHTVDHDQPLAEKMRPQLTNELLGQQKIWHDSSVLRNVVAKDKFFSLLFWGPPGTGKTSLARIIGRTTQREVCELSAVLHGVKDIRSQIERSQELLAAGEPGLLVFMDEIHRLSKNQQDALLPALESGLIRFIGATTENPSFEVNNAILSRSLVFKFESLDADAIEHLLDRALEKFYPEIDQEVFRPFVSRIASQANGDGRRALNCLEAICATAEEQQSIDLQSMETMMEDLSIHYDRDGEYHYDTVSALIKSMRASHPDAALHYLARMISGGEDPVFIARRLVIFASEDIGNANPTALLMANSGMQSVHMIGMPEARIILGQVVSYLSSSPKSNRSYLAINKALEDVEKFGDLEIPMHLRNAPTKLMKNSGYGKGYRYPHEDYSKSREVTYFPKELAGTKYYSPGSQGTEVALTQYLNKYRPVKD